ncbi:MAG: hypothetical protein IPM52_09195 [Bacteroidetes bacterium]|nr:hypothetical protein [Bacteroidota bacterium]
MDLGVGVQCSFRDVDCNNVAFQCWSGMKYKKAKSIEKNCSSWGAFPQYRAEKNVSIIGYFEYASYSNQNVLTW